MRRGYDRRIGLLVALVALIAATPHATVPTNRVTVISDSVGGVLQWVSAAHDLLGARLDLQVEPEVCRKLVSPGCAEPGEAPPASALDTIDQLGRQLGPVVVIDVGYNDVPTEYAAGIDPVMQALVAAGVQHVIWVTLAERQANWAQTNAAIRAAPARWPQLTVADWAPIAATGPQWFVDNAHMNWEGGVALARFLRPFVLAACGAPCVPPQVFCGLIRTASGFVPVRAAVIDCGDARTEATALAGSPQPGWSCNAPSGGDVFLDCTRGEEEIGFLRRSPLPAVRRWSGAVRLANWLFRVGGRRLEAREDGTPGWVTLGRAPFCLPVAPRAVLVALRLEATTPGGTCFAPRP